MIVENIKRIQQEIGQSVELVVVSKFRSVEEIKEAYSGGHRQFAENRVQALLERAEQLPKDIHWHLIGHLQSNKVKYIVPFIAMIQSVDSLKLLKEINEQAQKHDRIISCLLQIHIAEEETKFGLSEQECEDLLKSDNLKMMHNIQVRGLMGMATNTEDIQKVENEMQALKRFYDRMKSTCQPGFEILSMGMSSDYKIAVKCGSNMVRVGSKVFSAM
jgi:PLP dependent protein